VLASEAKGRGFDSRRARHFLLKSILPIAKLWLILSRDRNALTGIEVSVIAALVLVSSGRIAHFQPKKSLLDKSLPFRSQV
jgi:hypothetical protein